MKKKQNKNDWRAGKNQINATKNKKGTLEALINKYIYKEIFDEIGKKIDQIRELTNEIKHDYLTYYFKGDASKRRFDDFNNGTKLFLKNASWWNKAKRSEKTIEYIQIKSKQNIKRKI